MTHTMGGTVCTEPPQLAPTTPTLPQPHTAPTVPTRMPPVIGTPGPWGAEQSRKGYITVSMAS
jgi:hypothetical protein